MKTEGETVLSSLQEQEDLIDYMKRLETTQPEKVRLLWPHMPKLIGGGGVPLSGGEIPRGGGEMSRGVKGSGGWEDDEDEMESRYRHCCGSITISVWIRI